MPANLKYEKRGKIFRLNSDGKGMVFIPYGNAKRGTLSASKLNAKARAFLYHSDKGISDYIGDNKK